MRQVQNAEHLCQRLYVCVWANLNQISQKWKLCVLMKVNEILNEDTQHGRGQSQNKVVVIVTVESHTGNVEKYQVGH